MHQLRPQTSRSSGSRPEKGRCEIIRYRIPGRSRTDVQRAPSRQSTSTEKRSESTLSTMLTQKPSASFIASLDSCTDAPTYRQESLRENFRHPAGKDLKKLDREKVYINLYSSRSFKEKMMCVGSKRRSALMKSLLRRVPWRTRRDVFRVLRELFRHLSQTEPPRRSAALSPIPPHLRANAESECSTAQSADCRAQRKTDVRICPCPRSWGDLLSQRKSGEGTNPVRSRAV